MNSDIPQLQQAGAELLTALEGYTAKSTLPTSAMIQATLGQGAQINVSSGVALRMREPEPGFGLVAGK